MQELQGCDFDPESGRSSGGGNGNPLQYSCLEKPKDRGAWRATVHGVSKEADTTEQLNTKAGCTLVFMMTGKSGPRFLHLSPISVLDLIVPYGRDILCIVDGMFQSILGLHPLDANSARCRSNNQKGL